MRALLVDAPEAAQEAINLPELELAAGRNSGLDYIHLFTVSQDDLDRTFPELRTCLAPTGMLWVSWPKARKLGTDLTLPVVINIGYRHGLVESTCLSVDATWSALKFTHPKKGKTYRNSYGQLPGT